MTMSRDARSFLKQIRELDELIDTYQEELDMQMTRLTSTTVKPKEINVMTSKKDTMAEDVEKIIEWRKLINETIDKLVDMKTVAKKIIDTLENPRYQCVLIKYYFQRKTLEQIAVDLDKSYQWTCEIRDRALKDFSEKFSEKN